MPAKIVCGPSYDPNKSHDYQPRYDEVEEVDKVALEKEIEAYSHLNANMPISVNSYIIKKKIYVCDICVLCGEQIMRGSVPQFTICPLITPKY